MGGGDVVGLALIRGEVVERKADLALVRRGWQAVLGGRHHVDVATIGMREMELPFALTNGFEAVAIEIGEGFARRGLLALEQRKEGLAVDFVLGLGRRAGFDNRRDDVDVGG